MSQKSLSNWLKIMIIGVAICGIIFCVFILPEYEKPIFILTCLTFIPCYIALIFSWQIASNIGKNRSFIKENAVLLKRISILAILDVLFLFIWNMGLYFIAEKDFTLLMKCILIDFIGIVASVVFASLSHLVYKAAEIQEENNLTI